MDFLSCKSIPVRRFKLEISNMKTEINSWVIFFIRGSFIRNILKVNFKIFQINKGRLLHNPFHLAEYISLHDENAMTQH